jgi:hypothetical protein
MPWTITKAGTPTAVIAAVNALVTTDQSAGGNAQLVRAQAIMIAEINAVGGSYVQLIGRGNFSSGDSRMIVTVQPVPFVDATGAQVSELSPNALP